MGHPLLGPALGFARRLRFPILFWITATLFVLDLFVLDPLPFMDELLLGLGTVLLASWKTRREPGGDRERRDPDQQ